MLVTTSYNPSMELLHKAGRLAADYGGQLVQRNKYSLEHLRKNYKEKSLLLVTRDEIRYYEDDHPAYFFHPSMALVRVKRMQRGESDLLIEASGAEVGQVIVDCTAGLASDAIVFSYAVGKQGKVTALESEEIPAMLIHEGLAVYESEIAELNEAMRRIEVKQMNHLAYLQQLADQSVDIVYFDPMFRSPIEESQAISHLRRSANDEAVSLASISEARRVARKSIVLKESRDSKEFDRLGFEHVLRSTTKTTYGVIRLC
ncbi:class I SAM-dependent methyltransferase [Paenibacillus alba]|uniref:Class I SAM-dependent methyltransferase n=1 Tax=Paenibacillus alba TaxID=1197127 RepID=A0ABU6G2Y8_9BACL|nr:class I SAM-dependent methyltransferase [Paenibacillus alba]MEC0228345.1 class I SAM-dependent methyltransferase [Paenibacillus alba]